MASNAKEQTDILKVVRIFNEFSSLSSLFGQLNDICQSFSNANATRQGFSWMIFELIWKNYLTLFDAEEFVNGITGDYCKDNHRFLRQYFIMSNSIISPLSMKHSREIFFALVDRCNQSKRIQTYLEKEFSNERVNNICRYLLYICLKICNSLNLILTFNDLVKYQNNLFDVFIRYLDRDFRKRENSREDNLLIEQMRLFLRNRSSITSTIPLFINAQCPQACLRWLTLEYLNSHEYEFILLMLYSMARHDDGAMVLKNAECVKIVRQFHKNELPMRMDWILDRDWYLKIQRILDMIYALLIDPADLYLEEMNTGMIKRLVFLTRTSLESSQYICKEYHVGELLIILMKLCTDESMLDYILQQDQYPDFFFFLFYRLLWNMDKDVNDLAMTALVNILWSMSFDHQYQKYLIQHLALIKRLRQISSNNTEVIAIYRPNQMSSLKRTLDGIWQNLYPGQLEIPSRNSSTCSVMISYSPMNIDFCREFYHMFVPIPELSISVDFKSGKYSWKETAEMIAQADVVLFLLSNEFYQSKSCRQELIYVTDALKKLFFPIFIDREFKPIGWLQKRVVRLRSIRFGEKDFVETCEDLLGLINENLSMNISWMKNSSDVKKWNSEDIEKWFVDQRLRLDLCDFYHFQNGQELLLYAQATLAFSWVKEYERIKERFEEKLSLSQEQFFKFIYALKRLLK